MRWSVPKRHTRERTIVAEVLGWPSFSLTFTMRGEMTRSRAAVPQGPHASSPMSQSAPNMAFALRSVRRPLSRKETLRLLVTTLNRPAPSADGYMTATSKRWAFCG
jgi:hypothetical protein